MEQDKWRVFGVGLLLILGGFLLAYQFVEPAPKKNLTIATGSEAGAYHAFAKQYAARLAEQGIALKVMATKGSIDNLKKLAEPDSGIDIAFVQGGVVGAKGGPEGLIGLGSLYREPLWVFSKSSRRFKRLTDMKGKRVAIGGVGSGTRAVALQLLAENGIGKDEATLMPLGGEGAVKALKKGRVDALMMVAGVTSPLVQSLLRQEKLRAMSFDRAQAYALHHRFLSVATLPEGGVELSKNIPPSSLNLIAPAATLVARDSLHPALVTLVLQTARTVHGAGGAFEKPGEFPSRQYVEFPLSDEAARYYRSGPSLLQRYLPFWAADLLDRLKVMLIPLLTLLIPLAKILPPLYRWRIRSRIYRWYKDLLEIEAAAHSPEGRIVTVELKRKLAAIEAEVQNISVPLSYADAVYSLRMHVDLVRDTVDRVESGSL